ncbi:DoxX-like protein [Kribbella amoyensis]|uniref:DoxX-like protein n=1 Tax=Kribbella amoyensis TaxID=996641 RepID=A0A561BUF9_9ACTN|nr:DoxX family protein [Kribbella amoyensis]TWD82516.1 DoxX-like protein [Kribbella amoyensis]
MLDPWWPLAALAVVQFTDALLCLKPVRFVQQCLLDVGFPRRLWWVLTPLKLAAAAGLVLGIWVTPLAVLTTAALVAYFVVAIVMHLRAHDYSRNLFANATGMLALCVATFVFVLRVA